MTGRKVTRRASMRRKSMRSPSVTRSTGSKTPRSVVSEPHASGQTSLNSSSDKLDSELVGSMSSLPANNSSERLSKAEKTMSYASVAKDHADGTDGALSSSELLATELAAVKIADSKENLAEVVKSESKTSLNEIAANNEKNESKASLNEIATKNQSNGSITMKSSQGSINDLARNGSKASLNRSNVSLSKLSQSNPEIASEEEKVAEPVLEEAKRSTDELVAVSLNENIEEKEAKEESEPVATETAAPATEAATVAQTTEAPAQVTEEETKKSCIAQKAAKCRCIIS